MKIILAEHFGICFGVRDAIAQAKRVAAMASLTILGGDAVLAHREGWIQRMLDTFSPRLAGVIRSQLSTALA